MGALIAFILQAAISLAAPHLTLWITIPICLILATLATPKMFEIKEECTLFTVSMWILLPTTGLCVFAGTLFSFWGVAVAFVAWWQALKILAKRRNAVLEKQRSQNHS
jgi:hypothetical protein